MKLSDAIRLGSMLKPQGFDGRNKARSCALRAAGDAVGISDYLDSGALNYAALARRWPILRCPVQHPLAAFADDVMSSIYHLNDKRRWTREQIADWVETLESERQPAVDAATELAAVSGAVERS